METITEISKRQQLKDLSLLAREFQNQKITENTDDISVMMFANKTINFILLEYFYKNENETEFKTFDQWKNAGATVVKGAKARFIWGQPIKKEDKENKVFSFSPLIAVFSNKQVYFPAIVEKKEIEKHTKVTDKSLNEIL